MMSSKIFDKSITKEAFKPLIALKEKSDAVMVGCNTIIADNANLIGNEFYGINNKIKRIVLDSRCRISITARIFTLNPERTIIATSSSASKIKINKIIRTGAKVIICGTDRVNLKDLFRNLYKLGIKSVLVEGGGILNYSLLHERLIDILIVAFFPFAVGNSNAPALFDGNGFKKLLYPLKLNKVKVLNGNIFAYYRLKS